MKRRYHIHIVLLIGLVTTMVIAASPPKQADPMKETLGQKKTIKLPSDPCEEPASVIPAQRGVDLFMREKLGAAKQVVEGLAIEDFDLIRKGADKLIVMSHAAGWQVLQGPVYLQDSSDFRSSAKQIIEACDADNLEAAAMGYVQVTLNCVRCHKHVRKAKVAAIRIPLPGVSVTRRASAVE